MEQVQRFLIASRWNRQEALFFLTLATGMQRGELLGLKWQDINFQMGTLQVRRILTRVPSKARHPGGPAHVEAEPKTDKGRRSILLSSLGIEALKGHQIRQMEEKL